MHSYDAIRNAISEVLYHVISWRDSKEEIIFKTEEESFKLEIWTFTVSKVETIVVITTDIIVLVDYDINEIVVDSWRESNE